MRALIVKFGAIGDVLMAIAAADALRAQGYALDWVCGPGVLPILSLYPWITPIVADDRALLTGSMADRLRVLSGLWRVLGGRHYDLVATLYYDRRYRMITLPVRAGRRLMLSATDRRYRVLPGRRHTDEFARILLDLPERVAPTQIEPVRPPAMQPAAMPADHGRERIAIVPAGARNLLAEATLRRWPAELYVELATRLLAARPSTEIVLIGGLDDTWVQPQFTALVATGRVHDLIGRLPLDGTVALLDTASLAITHDTGPLHLAGITRASILALFGPTDPHSFMPRRPGVTAVWGGEGFRCRPCYDGHAFPPCPANDCMRQITVDQAFTEAVRLLDERAAGELAPPRILTPPTTLPGSGLVALKVN